MSLLFTLGTTPRPDDFGNPAVGLRNVVVHQDLPTALIVGGEMIALLDHYADYIEAYEQEGVVIRYD